MNALTRQQIGEVEDYLNADDGIYETVQGCLARAFEDLGIPANTPVEVDYFMALVDDDGNAAGVDCGPELP